mmetsp:Transcript_29466/g.77912  ORF Transcript_29466/g.77912 Transcript_29466/m.77912 type:complete len:262 (-) Transcript_29466:582-1367(-)
MLATDIPVSNDEIVACLSNVNSSSTHNCVCSTTSVWMSKRTGTPQRGRRFGWPIGYSKYSCSTGAGAGSSVSSCEGAALRAPSRLCSVFFRCCSFIQQRGQQAQHAEHAQHECLCCLSLLEVTLVQVFRANCATSRVLFVAMGGRGFTAKLPILSARESSSGLGSRFRNRSHCRLLHALRRRGTCVAGTFHRRRNTGGLGFALVATAGLSDCGLLAKTFSRRQKPRRCGSMASPLLPMAVSALASPPTTSPVSAPSTALAS